ncbi:ATP-binding cassette domain-containing protein [Bacillus sp. DJP31]|uniref:ATP-binding cassette domain-containing protein n=1 Tax=Bacillus sp. DJP31 TaxID=3409789 RepID=UPI003BB7D9DB
MLEINNLTKTIKKKKVLNSINYSFTPGVYGILGPNGAGKTTFMRCLTNLYKYKQGEITYSEKNIIDNKSYIGSLGYLSQKFDLFKELNVREVMEYFAAIKNIEKDKRADMIEESVGRVNLSDRINDKVKSLSGGMIRRLGIAQAMLNNPNVLIFDEPTAGLDPEERMRFKSLITSNSKERVTIISTHIVEDVEAICDKIIIMKEGKIITSGDGNKIRNIAMNKVYEILPEEQSTIQGEYYLEKQIEKENNQYLRILTEQPQKNRQAVTSTIEDGYLWALKWL